VPLIEKAGRYVSSCRSLEYWTRRWINPSALIDITSADFEATVLMLPRSVFELNKLAKDQQQKIAVRSKDAFKWLKV
jgi:hypothetical protein